MPHRGSGAVFRLISMSLRQVPDAFEPRALTEIDRRLAEIKRDRGVHIPLAIESGSRAWGFPSPDSDYDCRFFYVRTVDAHLTPWPERDVIETPLIDMIDLNGWDLAKALGLLLKGNAVVIEWLTSPICYSGEAWFREEFLAIAKRHAKRELIARHYLHLGLHQNQRNLETGAEVPLKRIFYSVRPAASLRWLRLHPEQSVAPMNFQTLMAECQAPADVAALLADLVDAKSRTRELGEAPLPPEIADFIASEFERASQDFPERRSDPEAAAHARQEAAEFYQSVVKRLDSRT